MLQSGRPRQPILARIEDFAGRVSRWSPVTQAWVIAGASMFVAALFILVLVLPGKTYSLIYAHDMMIFFDGAHRVLTGQLPNRDFHTPLGLAAYLLPAAGLRLSGSFGGMMPVATALFTLIFTPLLIHACTSRLPLAYSAIFAFFELALITSPASIGETLLSFGMFYNRWGYALLALLFLLVLPQLRGRPRLAADALVAGAVLIITFYLKVSYFAVGLGFTILLLLFRESRRMALAALAVTTAGIAIVHLMWGATGNYLADIDMAARVSGAVRISPIGLIRLTVDNAGMIVPFVLILGLAILARASLRVLFLCLVMAGAGVLIFNQNFQGPGIMTLVPAAIVAALMIPRAREGGTTGAPLAPLLLTAALALPPAIIAAQSIFLHGWMVVRGGYPNLYMAEIDGFMTQEVPLPEHGEPGFALSREAYRSGVANLDMLKLIRAPEPLQALAQPEYFWTVQDGARLLSDPRLSGPVLTLDMANPFNAVTGRNAPVGTDSWYHARRTLSDTVYRAPEQIFANVAVVMVPKAPVQPPSHQLLERLYGNYVRRNYDLVAISDYWFAYRRKQPVRPS